MSTNYLDTLTMFCHCPYEIKDLFTTHWILDNSNPNKYLHNYCIKTPYTFTRLFPDLYGYRRLYVTCSLPKLYHGTNDNTYNLTDYDNKTFLGILSSELDSVLDISKLPTSLKDWQPSRTDLFRTRTINPADRQEYLYGYGRRSYRGNGAVTYMNTAYLSANRDMKKAGIIERDYNKTVERQEKKSFLYGNLPTVIENEHEWLMHELDISPDQFRYEFSLRRRAVVWYMDKYNCLHSMETVMNQKFQEMVLNDLVMRRGLLHWILSKKAYRQTVGLIFPTQHSQNLALKLAESIRNKKPAPMSDSQRYRIKRVLDSFYIDTATTNFVTIKGLGLL